MLPLVSRIKKKRSERDVKNFITRRIDSWKRANKWVNNTGQGPKDEGKDVKFKDVVLKMCPHYYDMVNFLSSCAGVWPILDDWAKLVFIYLNCLKISIGVQKIVSNVMCVRRFVVRRFFIHQNILKKLLVVLHIFEIFFFFKNSIFKKLSWKN